jgi:flagellar FliJ protein
MADSSGLLLAIAQAERRRDDILRALAQSQQRVQSAADQLDQLRAYAGDTDQRWVHTGAVGLSAELVKHHHQFSDRLQQAMSMQGGVITNLQRQSDNVRQQLQKAESRVAGLKNVLQKRRAEAQLLAVRREQAAMDEMAAQLYARTRAQLQQGEAR